VSKQAVRAEYARNWKWSRVWLWEWKYFCVGDL